MKEVVIGGLLGLGLGLLFCHGAAKRALCKACLDPSVCQQVHDHCREEQDAMRRREYGFMS